MTGFFLTSLIRGLLPAGGLGDAAATLIRRAATGGFEPREGPRLSDLAVQTAGHGRAIPRVYGTVRLAGNIIWARPITETRRVVASETASGGGLLGLLGAGRLLSAGRVEYDYTASFAIGLAQGPILGVRRIWADEILIWSADPAAGLDGIAASAAPGRYFRLHRGTASQTPDPLILSVEGPDRTPAFRDLAYIVFQDLPLADYGNRVPLIEVEIVRGSPVAVGEDPLALAHVTPVLRDDRRSLPSLIDGMPADLMRGPAAGAAGDTGYFWTDGGAADGSVSRYVSASNPVTRVRRVVRQRKVAGRWLPEERWTQTITQNAAARGCLWAAADRPVQIYARDTESAGVFVEIETGRHRLIGLPGSLNGDCRGVTAHGSRIWVMAGRPGGLNGIWALDEASGGADATLILDGLPPQRMLMRGDATGLLLLTANRLRHLTGVTAVADRDVTLAPWPDLRPLGLHQTDDGSVAVVFANQLALIARDGRVLTAALEGEPASAAGFATGAGSLIAVPWIEAVSSFAYVDRWVALTRPDETAELAATVADLAAAAGVDADELDLAAVSGMALRGYVVARNGSARSAIEPLLMACFVDAVERGGRLALVPRGGEIAATVAADRLAAHEDGATRPPLVERNRSQQAEMPREVAVGFIDGAADGRPGLARARRTVGGAEDRRSVELPLVLTAAEATGIARALADTALIERDRWRLRLGWGDIALEPGDVIALAPDAASAAPGRLRIERMAFGTPGLIEIEAVADHGALYEAARPGAAPIASLTAAPAPVQGLADVTVLDLPPIVEPAPDPGLVVLATGGGGGLRAARVEVSTSTAGPWTTVAALAPAAQGAAQQTLAGGSTWLRDDINTLTVDFVDDGRIAADITDADAESGRSLALVGAEIMAYGAITRVSTGIWRISRLWRGLRGTEAAVTGHGAGETVTLLDPARLAVLAYAPGDIGRVLWFRAVSGDGGTGPARAVTIQGLGLRPFAPARITARRQGDGSVRIEWLRADRHANWTNGADEPMSEASERYQLEILTTASVTATARRVVIVEAATAWSYSAAQQYADFFTQPATLGLRVAQIGAATGPGPTLAAIVNP
ncbi:phage tail protein [Tistrella bauzanensis]|uniref:phage tail protein n=1 Tax=Tistrella TaxID=171436 RepID=UPI0031F6C61A